MAGCNVFSRILGARLFLFVMRFFAWLLRELDCLVFVPKIALAVPLGRGLDSVAASVKMNVVSQMNLYFFIGSALS